MAVDFTHLGWDTNLRYLKRLIEFSMALLLDLSNRSMNKASLSISQYIGVYEKTFDDSSFNLNPHVSGDGRA